MFDMRITDSNQWYEVYKEISRGLLRLLSLHVDEKSNPSLALFNICSSSDEFKLHNKWFEKFLRNKEYQFLDPIHIFASLSDPSLSEKTYLKRINVLLDVLISDVDFLEVEYVNNIGCPSPPSRQLLAFRSADDQREIWDIFNDVYLRGYGGLQENWFDAISKLNKISLRSFTVFIFWISPDSAMPLDKESFSLLKRFGVISRVPKNKLEYEQVIFFEDSNLYRSVALVARHPASLLEMSEDDVSLLRKYIGLKPSDYLIEIDDANVIGGNEIVGLTTTSVKQPSISSDRCRVLSVKPLSGCDVKFRKTLKEGYEYKFYPSFENHENNVSFNTLEDHCFYGVRNLNINVCAVVGENGTGKSTLIELLVAIFNNLTKIKIGSSSNNINLKEAKGLRAQFFYESVDIYKIVIIDEVVEITKYSRISGGKYDEGFLISIQEFNLDDLFYTITVNFSLHGLNSLHSGDWLSELFHKNDAYQTPVVIEPFRKEGNIDVNRQDILVKQRLLANLLQPEEYEENFEEDKPSGSKRKKSHRYIKTDTKATKITIIPYPGKTKDLYSGSITKKTVSYSSIEDQFEEFFNNISKQFKVKIGDVGSLTGSRDVEQYAKRYIIKKAFNIALTYDQYRKYVVDFRFSNIEEFVKYLAHDKSHITFKLRQAINFLKYDLYWAFSDGTYCSIEDISNSIEGLIADDSDLKVDFLLPPPIFTVDIILEGGVEFSTLSSGEKQKIYSINSLLYHLRNVDSAHYSPHTVIQYSYMNIFLDEIELCFHPELQRTYLRDLMEALDRLELENINGLNICFVTHSPFVLSDIIGDNVLYLKKEGGGSSSSIALSKKIKTFSANIHDLLSAGFFMKSSVGAYAENAIKEIVSFGKKLRESSVPSALKPLYEEKRDYYNFILDSVADTELKGMLSNHLQLIESELDIRSNKDFEIIQLERRLKALRERS